MIHDVRIALRSVIAADEDVRALVGAHVYDDPAPEGAPITRIVLGAATSRDDDSKTLRGHEDTITVHAWSDYRGAAEVERMLEAIDAVLHNGEAALNAVAELIASGWTVWSCRREFDDVLDDEDGKTKHGVARYRVRYCRSTP